MKKVIWIAGHGPDRSHDSLHSDVFDTRSDALKFVAGRQYWRISRMEYAAPWSAGKRTDEIGGKDVEREIEKVRQDEQYRTMRRVSDAEALRLWRQRMRERHGPGGTMRNPRRRGVFLNDNERELWVRNDEFLYSMWRGSGMSMRKFLRANRAAIDNVIVQTLKPDSERPPGYGQWPRSYNPRRGLRTRRSRRR